MKRVILIVALLLSQITFCQEKFSFTKGGLTPKHITSSIDNTSQEDLFQKTLSWLKENYKYANVETSEQENWIIFTDLKDNLINVSKRYYNSKYKIKISFEGGQYRFEPIEFSTKQNSKYDMGWEQVDLKDGSKFFKKERPIKATKSYVKKIPRLMNDLHESLYKYLTSN